MSLSISANCQAILLLTAPLMNGKAKQPAQLLKQSEYDNLTLFLKQMGMEPADLLSAHSGALGRCSSLFEEGRLASLMARGFQLAQAVDYWSARSIWVVSRADSSYPKRIKSRLRRDAPAILYGCGDIRAIDRGGLAVVGSRDADEEILEYARVAGERAAHAGRGLISGGAKGVDSAAMDGAYLQGGFVCNVMAEGLAQAAIGRRFREGLQQGRALLVSPYDPSAGFNVGHAIARNKFIFALSDLGLVVNSDLEKGGTWAGAIEQLRKLHYVPLFIRSLGKRSPGLNALLEEGALPWPNPADGEALNSIFVAHLEESASITPPSNGSDGVADGTDIKLHYVDDAIGNESSTVAKDAVSNQAPLFDQNEGSISKAGLHSKEEAGKKSDIASENIAKIAIEPEFRNPMFETFTALIKQILKEPKNLSKIAQECDLNQAQTRIWLDRLVEQGFLSKKNGHFVPSNLT